jgi:hypothetical protein
MKKSFLLAIFSLAVSLLLAQAPQSFKYQAVARDGAGNILAGRAVGFRISILSGSIFGATVYSETHSGKVTNAFGLVDFEIGKGSPVYGTFSSIPWGTNTYLVKVDMDPNNGTSYLDMGSSQLLSVPYALFARDVQNNDDADADPTNEIQTISISGADLTLSKGGGTVTVPGSDNWGIQTVVTDATLSGNGLTTNPLTIADNAVTSMKILDGAVTSADILDGTIANIDLASNSVTGSKIADLSVTSLDIADRAITVAKISSAGVLNNQVLQYDGLDVGWGYAAGSEIRVTCISVSCASLASFSSTYVKIANLGTFTKVEATSKLEILFNGRVTANTIIGTGAHFELRLDDVATTNGRARANIRLSEAGAFGIPVCIAGIFTGFGTGIHTISIWVKGSTSGTTAMVDPGCWSDDHIIVREIQ